MKRQEIDLGGGRVGRLLFDLALPTIVSQVVNMLYNLVDRIYIGHMKPVDTVGALALTGVGVCLPIIMVASAFSALIGMGGAPRASIEEGQGNLEGAQKIMGNSFSILLMIAAVLTVVLQLFAESLLLTFGASENTIGYAMDYMRIYSLGTVFVLLTLGMNAYITAQGFTTVSMKTVLIGAGLNMVLDPILIFGLHMGVKGAALATICSQAVSMLWVLRFLLGKQTKWRLRKSDMKLVPSVFLPSLALGLSPFIMQSTESLLAVCFNSSLLKYGGDIAVGAMTVLSSIMQFAMMPLQGLTQGAQPIISYNYGAQNASRVRTAFRCLLRASLVYSAVLWASVMLFPQVFVSLFNNDPGLVGYAGGPYLYVRGGPFWHSASLPDDLRGPGQCKGVPVSGGPAENYSADSPDLYSAQFLRQQSLRGLSGGTCGGRSGRGCNCRTVCGAVPPEHDRPGLRRASESLLKP